MFEYMDGIVDAVEEIGQAAVDVAVFVTICTAKAVLIKKSAGLQEKWQDR